MTAPLIILYCYCFKQNHLQRYCFSATLIYSSNDNPSIASQQQNHLLYLLSIATPPSATILLLYNANFLPHDQHVITYFIVLLFLHSFAISLLLL